ncbi:hypothetical protein [Fusibacter ferrireducens]|uniref:Uncharacterized protein n=1 Tax=Fusibacter ferrireducens TaxID=2785058 RepID=A0ABS0A031_9FIRM|nr:hypothetical protein [Fusibacter ferrireducens]MBF4696053.1 hypothetical protein [Fusibacter ferrireducens]
MEEKFNSKIKNYNMIFNTTMGIVILWFISGIRKLLIFSHYGISMKFFEFDILESFIPIVFVSAQLLIFTVLPIYLYLKVYKKNSFIKTISKILISIIFGLYLFIIYMFPNINYMIDGPLDRKYAFIILGSFIFSMVAYFSILNVVSIIKDEDYNFNLLKISSVFISMLYITLIFLIALSALFVDFKNYGYFDIVEKDENQYLVIEKISSGLIVADFRVELDESSENCFINYSEYKIISAENVKLSKEHFDKVIIVNSE